MSALMRIKGGSLVDRVVQVIGQDIISNRYPPGAQLPNETEWCDLLGVSRSVVREALRVLVSKNLLDIRSRLGGRVRDPSAWNLLDPDILTWRAKGDDQDVYITELFELRRVIEPAAAALAAARISPAQLEELRLAYREMLEAGEDTARFFEPDCRFHRILLGAVGNSLFRALGETVTVALDITLRLSLDAPKGQQQSLPFHETVLEAIVRHDAAAASAAMLRLVDASELDVAEARAMRKSQAVKRIVALKPARRAIKTKPVGKTRI